MNRPETHYAKGPDGTSIAYQVVGNGPDDLVYASGIWSNVDVMWEHPAWAHFLERLASFSRLILFDMRGVGLSDRGPEPPVLELQGDDVGAVMDAADSDTAVVFGGARAATMAMLFRLSIRSEPARWLCTHRSRRRSRRRTSPTAGRPRSNRLSSSGSFARIGTGRNLELQAPSMADDAAFVNWWARFERLVARPSEYEELARILTDIDVRSVLPAIHVPTLVLHRSGDAIVSTSQARYVADHIAGARLVALPGVE